MGDHRNVTQTLEEGRRLLDSLRDPERPDNHFVVDHDKFDYCRVGVCRLVWLSPQCAKDQRVRSAGSGEGSVLCDRRRMVS